jgi:hypothetical protein
MLVSCKFVNALRTLKESVVRWVVGQRREQDKVLLGIEDELNQIYDGTLLNLGSMMDMDRVRQLEATRQNIFLEQEVWRLKSRALWLAVGVMNTNFFQDFVYHRKSYNSI